MTIRTDGEQTVQPRRRRLADARPDPHLPVRRRRHGDLTAELALAEGRPLASRRPSRKVIMTAQAVADHKLSQRLPDGVGRPPMTGARLTRRHRPFRRRQLPSRPSGRLSRRPVRPPAPTTTGRSSAPASRRRRRHARQKLAGQDWLTTVVEQEADAARRPRHRRHDRLPPARRQRRHHRRASPIPPSASSR